MGCLTREVELALSDSSALAVWLGSQQFVQHRSALCFHAAQISMHRRQPPDHLWKLCHVGVGALAMLTTLCTIYCTDGSVLRCLEMIFTSTDTPFRFSLHGRRAQVSIMLGAAAASAMAKFSLADRPGSFWSTYTLVSKQTIHVQGQLWSTLLHAWGSSVGHVTTD